MPAPRRPRPGARRPAGGVRRTRTAAPVESPARGGPLTTRAAILLLVVCTLVVSAVLPLKTFLEQRGRIADMEREQAATRERVAALEHAKRQLEDPAFVAAEARRRLHMARPGEVSYVLLAPEGTPAEAEEGAGDPDAAWWDQVWDSVAVADGREDAAEPPQP